MSERREHSRNLIRMTGLYLLRNPFILWTHELLMRHSGRLALSSWRPKRVGLTWRSRPNRRLMAAIYGCDGLRRPTRPRMRRPFLGEIARPVATREILRHSLSQTLGMISSANSSVIC